MIIKKFIVVDDYQELLSEEHFNDIGLKEKVVFFDNGKITSEVRYYYNENQNLIEEIVLENGITKHTYDYDRDQNKVVREAVYFGTDLYEEVLFNFKDDITERVTKRDGDIVGRMISSGSDDNLQVKFYDGEDRLIQRNSTSINSEGLHEVLFYNELDELVETQISKFNEKNQLINQTNILTEYNERKEVDIEYESENVVRIIKRSEGIDGYEIKVIYLYEYDKNGNQIKEEVKTDDGELLRVLRQEYNNDNMLLEEVLISKEYMERYSGIINLSNSYHFIYEIEK